MPGICSQEGRCTELSQNVPGKRAKAREGQAGIWLIKVPRRRAGAWAIQQRLGQTQRSLEHLPSTCRKRGARQEAAECFMSRGAVLGSVGEGEPVGGRELGESTAGSWGEMQEGDEGKPGQGRKDQRAREGMTGRVNGHP